MNAKISYLVLAYRNPLLLGQLIGWLSLGSKHIFVHVDKRRDIAEFETKKTQPAIFIRSRHECPWGTWGRIGASIDLLRAGLETDATHFCLLSEDSFPLWNPEKISTTLDEPGIALRMDCARMSRFSKPISRISEINRFQGDPRLVGPLRKILQRAPGASKKVDWRKKLDGLTPYAGDSWWIITRKAAEEVLDFTGRELERMDFFKSTWVADEHFFQTVLGNSAHQYVFGASPVYTDWNASRSKFLPIFLDASDFDNLRAQKEHYLFARKLSTVESDLARRVPELWE